MLGIKLTNGIKNHKKQFYIQNQLCLGAVKQWEYNAVDN